MLPTPETEEKSHDNLQQEVERITKKLTDSGSVELESFLEFHRVHLPCFTWVIYEAEIPARPVHSSQFGGYPSLYKGESFPKGCLFTFQIDLEVLPKRTQGIMGKPGLLQLFFYAESFD
jgi:hypothetical protein